MDKAEFEEVFTYDWYDGPISGVANRKGKPYFFEYQGYNEIAKDSFYLSPIRDEILTLIIESWQIWKRWDTAFHKGEIKKETHPYLPTDQKRGEEIKSILDKVLKIDPLNFLELDADFILQEGQEKILGMKSFLVKWKEKES